MVSLPGGYQQFYQQIQLHQQQNDYDDDNISLTGGGSKQRKSKVTRSGICLSVEQKMQLIDHIQERPQIWDNNSESFRSNQSRQTAFNEVAQLLSSDAAADETYSRIQVQEEWGKLRYCFTRIVKKLLEEGGGQIVEAQQAAITWPYWRRMDFLLDGVVQQLQNQPNAEGDAVQQQQENMQKSACENSPAKPVAATSKLRRRRPNLSRKNSNGSGGHDYLQEELNHSSNELLNQALGLSPQDLIMANFAATALNNSSQLIHQIQQKSAYGEPKMMKEEEFGGNGLVAPNDEQSVSGQQLMANVQQQHQQNRPQLGIDEPATTAANLVAAALALHPSMSQQQQTQKFSSMAIGNKRKRSSLDFLLRNSLQREEPMNTPSKYHSPPRTIADSICSSTGSHPRMSMSPKLEVGQKAVIIPGAEDGNAMECGSSSGAVPPEDINESFGRHMVRQLQTVASKDTLLWVEMRKELSEICFKYELRACKVQQEDGVAEQQ